MTPLRAAFEKSSPSLGDALDAKRYRWLRDHMWSQALSKVYSLPILWGVDYPGEAGKSMDGAIDAAMGNPTERSATVPPAPLPSPSVVVFMDGVDWQHHVGHDPKGATVYPSPAHVHIGSPCCAGCGIVRIEMRELDWPLEQNRDEMLRETRSGATDGSEPDKQEKSGSEQ